MDKKEKANNLIILIKKLFHSKTRIYNEEMLKDWVLDLMPFYSQEMLDIMIEYRFNESQLTLGYITTRLFKATKNDSLDSWGKFEKYCKLGESYFYSLDIETLNIMNETLHSIPKVDLDNIEKICTATKYKGSDKWQKEQYKRSFLDLNKEQNIKNKISLGDYDGRNGVRKIT